jgi:hypothetical protein
VDASIRTALTTSSASDSMQAEEETPRIVNNDGEEDEAGVRVWTDADDWKKIGDPILHIEVS